MSRLSQSTLIPFGFAVTFIGGAAAWMTTMHIKMDANAASLDSITIRQTKYQEDLHAIRESLSEIRGELKRLRR